ncbi:Vesicular glutamate transporter 2 [Frankliniella fusca]|uniref:Vesicular glutamate transporter 2 n=1 Tax=Frankliniella fusca TaxID=407009 RepID=A0AAE1HDH2_9NEOP|nr:Vesicular glutamate transporter 2 [Frankliniella fusca]
MARASISGDRQRLPDEANPPKKTPMVCFRRLQDGVPARVVLYMLSFTGFLVSFMMRTDINIAMVAMVRMPPVLDLNNDTVGGSSSTSSPSEPLYCYAPAAAAAAGANATGSAAPAPPEADEEGEFEWDARTQSAILGSFYWCYVLSQVMGGLLTQRFGTKVVFGLSQLVTAACSLLIPVAAEVHYAVLIVLRSVQGIASGLTWPAMYAAVGPWIPASERSRFMSSFQGFSFGIGLTYPLCGFIIAHFGWRVVFYVTGSLGMLWCVFWWLLAFDSPGQHPRITPKELRYIQSNVSNGIVDGKGVRVPWKKIFTSMPAWSIGITTFGRIWIHYVFIIPGPMYMKTVLGFSIQANGVLSGVPFLLSYLSSVVFCSVADRLVTKNVLSLTNTRKLMTAISQVLPGLLVLAIGYLGCHIELVLITWFLAVTLITAAYAGAMASVVDIAPNFAGPILAFAQTIHMTASFISPLVAGFITQESQSLEQWRKVFGVSAIVAMVTYIVFQIFGTADIQDWNYPESNLPSETESPSEPLKRRPSKMNRDESDTFTEA